MAINRTGLAASGTVHTNSEVLVQAYETALQEILRATNQLVPILTQKHNTEANRQAASFKIPRWTGAVSSLSTTQQAGLYPTTGRDTPGMDAVEFSWPTNFDWVGATITQQEMAETPIDLVVQMGVEQAERIAAQWDTDVYTAWRDADVSAIYDDFTDKTDTKPQVKLIGTASTAFINTSGVQTPSTGTLLMDMLDDFLMDAEIAKKSGNTARADRAWTWVVPPQVFRAFRKELQNLGIDALTLALVNGQEVLTYRGPQNVNIVRSATLVQEYYNTSTNKRVTAAGANVVQAYPTFLVTPAATAWLDRFSLPKLLPPENPANRTFNWLLDYTVQRMIINVDLRFLYPRWIRTQ